MKKPKYKTLAELKQAFDNGEIKKTDPLMLDNDCSHIYAGDGDRVFDGPGPMGLLEQALTLLGIPWSPV